MAKRELTKEQKQTLLLGVLGAVVLGAAIKMLALDPMLTKMAAARDTIAKLESKVRDAELMTRNAARNRQLLRDLTEDLIALDDTVMPLPNNEFSWAFRQIHNAGAKIGWRNINVKEFGRTVRDDRYLAKVSEGPYFQAYATQVKVKTGYDTMSGLIRESANDNPLVTVSRLRILPTDEPESHEVDLVLQYPVWTEPDDLRKQREMAGL